MHTEAESLGIQSPVAAVQRVAIELGERRYEIRIGSGLIGNPDSYADLPRGQTAVVVTHPKVSALYEATLRDALRKHYVQIESVVLPDGEIHKTWENLSKIFDALLSWSCDRRTTLFALGGGVIGDITGFAAACYQRGVPYVQVPTTLLAQVDSAVGGKTAINHPLGKNMIGAFHQPVRVVSDLDVLKTLPARELSAGLAEVIKYGPIADAAFLDWIDNHLDDLMRCDAVALAHAVRRSCEIKAEVVARDEREADVRAILNFGHTFGHAIETGLGHGAWLHGEAVGCGMVMAADLSVRLGLLDAGECCRLRSIVQRAGLPVKGPRLGSSRYLELMRGDKKAQDGKIRFVVLEALGRADVRVAPNDLVAEVIEDNCD